MLIDDLRQLREVCWLNPHKVSFDEAASTSEITMADVQDAAARLSVLCAQIDPKAF